MSASRAEWVASIRAIGQQADGILAVEIVRQEDLPDIVASVMLGNIDAGRLLEAVVGALDHINAAPRSRPCLCSCCPRPLRKRSHFTLAVAMPERSDASHYLALAVCARCGRTNTEIKPKVTSALQKLWPDLREVAISHPQGGRA